MDSKPVYAVFSLVLVLLMWFVYFNENDFSTLKKKIGGETVFIQKLLVGFTNKDKKAAKIIELNMKFEIERLK